MRVLGMFLVVGSLFGFVVGFALINPEFLGLPLGGYFGQLTKGGPLSVYVLSACSLFLGVKLMTRQTSRRGQKPDSDIDSYRSSHRFNK